MIKKSVSQQAAGAPTQPASPPPTHQFFYVGRGGVQSGLSGQGRDRKSVQHPASYPAAQIHHPAVSQTYSQPQSGAQN